jgi:alkanesulfonate monooxygenase SsuD/methylene tetrahydromethanopterin reductase-like flavin-dependent oxidoreductase (luciferase family)
MHITTFTEQPYTDLPEEEIIKNAGFFAVSNKFLDVKKGRQLYDRYIDEYIYCEELGFDGVMLNEHHANPFAMGCVMNIEAAILARVTKKVKIALMGNPLPVADPLRLAEEVAMIDMISGGRLITGWVRGAGSEQIANNINPSYNRERFEEAHDFIMDAWTKPGPWRYEGKHYHYRHVNPWALPYQKPIPQTWIPGLVSPESVVWTAKKRYTYFALATFIPPTMEMWDLYNQTAAEEGYQAGPECFGYMQKIVCADTDEAAIELAKNFVYGGGQPAFSRFEHLFPPGYLTKAATRRLAKAFTEPGTGEALLSGFGDSEGGAVDMKEAKRQIYENSFQVQLRNKQILAGTPDTVLQTLREVIEALRPGVFCVWQIEGGSTSHEQWKRSMDLIAEHIMPALREWADELGLVGPGEVKPGSRPLPADGRPEPVTGRPAEAVA